MIKITQIIIYHLNNYIKLFQFKNYSNKVYFI